MAALAELQVPTPQEVDDRLSEIEHLSNSGHTDMALLLAWSVLEASARIALGGRALKPLNPGSVLETLAFEGYLSPTESDRLRALVSKRNKFAHGDFSVRATAADVDELVRTIERVRSTK